MSLSSLNTWYKKLTQFNTGTWNVRGPDYVNVSASGVGSTLNAATANNPERKAGAFLPGSSGTANGSGGGQLWITLDPSVPNLIDAAVATKDNLNDNAVQPTSIVSLNNLLNGGTNVTIPTGSNLLDPNNHNTWMVLG